jgi:hypothetical protein
MAHFAELDSNNIVLRVIVINDSDLLGTDNIESEALGIAKCKQYLGEEGNWIQTSYNTRGGVHLEGKTPVRKNYAGIGYIYDPSRDAFINPKPIVQTDIEQYLTFDEFACLWICRPPQPIIGVTRV